MKPARRTVRLALGAALLSAVAGCATPIGVKRLSPQDANRELTASILTTGKPDAAALQVLYRLDLSQRYAKDPAGTIALLHGGLGQVDEPDRLYALAQLCFDHAQRTHAPGYAFAAAAYAWAFMFPDDAAAAPSRYDPRLRVAMDLYNRAITSALATGTTDEVDLSARTATLPFGTLDLRVDPTTFTYGSYRFTGFTKLADYNVRGLRNRYRRRGIGAPLAARVTAIEGTDVGKWLAPRARVPVTALVRFDAPRQAMSSGTLHATLELFDADTTRETEIDGRGVPLEAETTTTLAYILEGAPVWDFEIAGFRRGDLRLFGEHSDSSLGMLHPYDPGRIPVVFVHGTASSPARWAEMANELMNDPVLGRRYQFWFFVYNTGNPIAYSAMRLREALQQAVRDIDPNGTDPALRRMVVIGHSQGGLLTKMTAVDSGTRFWDRVSQVAFEQADLDADSRDLLRRSLFVTPLPFVKTVIFIATPHRGSFLAENFLGNIARKLVSLPGNLTSVGVSLVKLETQGAFKTAWTMPTAIDNMKWSNPFLQTLESLPIDPGVRAFSIIPVKGAGPPEEGNDGVVKYTSAHLEGVEHELIVRDAHSTQGKPETIEEVRRILYLHLDGAPSAHRRHE